MTGSQAPPAVAPGAAPPELRTERLLLRAWRATDREPFAAMNADPEVMRFIGSGVLHPVASDDLRARLRREWTRTGHGLWALERTADGAFLGFCGLTSPSWGGPGVEGETEVGWRLRRDAWGRGYAAEAAAAALTVAWRDLGLRAAIALVHPHNARSLALADRLGMRVSGTTRHLPTGWDVLVLRTRRPAGESGPAVPGGTAASLPGSPGEAGPPAPGAAVPPAPGGPPSG